RRRRGEDSEVNYFRVAKLRINRLRSQVPHRSLNAFSRLPPPRGPPPVHRRFPVRVRRRHLLIGDLLLEPELLELLVTLLVANVRALARLGISVDVPRLAVAHVPYDLSRCLRLQTRELLGRIGRF